MDTITTTESRESHQTVDTKTGEVHDHETVKVVTTSPAVEFVPPDGHHCTCAECLEWEEDVAHEIAILRERVSELETTPTTPPAPAAPPAPPTPQPTPAPAVAPPAETAPPPAPPAPTGETVVKPPPPEEKKAKKKYAGWFW